MLREFLRLEEPGAPLYGRYRREVGVERFDRATSLGFLRAGMEELGVPAAAGELEEAVDALDGIVGWLTYYGYYRAVRGLPHREALDAVFREGVGLVMGELERVIAPSRARYLAILRAVAYGARAWSDIKAYVVARTGSITNSRFSALLRNLVRYGYLAKEGDEYVIPDPVVRRAVLATA